MSRRKTGNFEYNYPLVIAYLDREGIGYEEYNDGQHLKILGATHAIDLWPSRMKYHIIDGEDSGDSYYAEHHRYDSLSFNFNESELDKLLNS